SDQVFAFGQVHSGFAADGGIYLRKKCSGNLHVPNSAHKDCSDEAANVAHDSAAECNEQGTTVAAGNNHLAKNVFNALHRLVLLTGGEEEGYRRFAEGVLKSVAPERPYFRRSQDEDAARQLSRGTLDARGEGAEESGARIYVVFCRRSINSYGLHV